MGQPAAFGVKKEHFEGEISRTRYQPSATERRIKYMADRIVQQIRGTADYQEFIGQSSDMLADEYRGLLDQAQYQAERRLKDEVEKVARRMIDGALEEAARELGRQLLNR